jgi:hypothetical protein
MDPGGNDGPNYHILVNGPNPKDVWVNYLYYDRGYAVPPVKKLIQFLSNYQPPGMQEYQPDRLLLLILPGREDWVKNQSPAQWPDANIHLSDYADDWKGMYLTGDIVPKIYAIFKSPYVDRVLVDQGQEFTVSSRPLLPHESRGPFGGNPESTKTAQYPLPFQCAK